MRKFLVVGCGGSGAKTQAYMMDQLKALMRNIEPERTELPKCWQFVTIDVPLTPENGPSKLPNVPQAGGRYIGIGSAQRYSTFDIGVSSELVNNGGLKEIATWAPANPGSIATPVSDGAGQYRALGRMLTIPAVKKIQEGLKLSLDVLNNAETIKELNELNYKITGKRADANLQSPVILIISSMAGGAGASMFLDVCRILSTLPNSKPQHTGVFMFTPEVFSEIPKEMMMGAWPNSLAMFGEAVAAQSGAAVESDTALFSALGINGANEPFTFARMFPIGNRMGDQGAVFGDGSSNGVYRGLGRALSALMYSEQACESFVAYSLGNTGSPDANRNYLGWAEPNGLPWDGMPWGTMGFAQLSMGRDKYAEYAAQRLARSAFDRLLRGHLDPVNPATAEEQLKARLEERLPNVFTSLKFLPQMRTTQPTGHMIGQWLRSIFGQELATAAGTCVATLRNSLPQYVEGQRGQEWAAAVYDRLAHPALAATITTDLNNAAYTAIYAYADELMNNLISVCEVELATMGVPFVEAVLNEITDLIQQRILPALNNISHKTANYNPLAKPGQVDVILQPINGRGRAYNLDETMGEIAYAYRGQFETGFLSALSRNLMPVLDDFRVSGLSRLVREINDAHADLIEADRRKDINTNLADVSTDDPVAWPTDLDERISDRFHGSYNEILITEVDSFPQDYDSHLVETVRVSEPTVFDVTQASRLAARSVILGDWETTDALKAPKNTLAPQLRPEVKGNRAGWVCKHLQNPPLGSGLPTRESSPAVFRALIRPKNLLGRARIWINRPGYHFQRFIGMDLRSYMTQDQSVNDVEYHERINRLRAAFEVALSQARPLAAVNAAMVNLVHGTDVTYRYSFSEIPFRDLSAAAELGSVLDGVQALDNHTKDVFEKSLSDTKKVQHIDIFGSYPNYSPIVFSSLLPRISDDWASRMDRVNAWKLRRARPLTGALPLSNDERKAMVAGWILGLAVGRVLVYNQGEKDARAYVFDAKHNEWLKFPHPLLTEPGNMRNPVDWMPAVIESVLLAYADSHNKNGHGGLAGSLIPYRVLRGIYDDSNYQPTNKDSGIQHPAVKVMAEFMRTGVFPARQNEIVGESIEERAQLIRAALNKTSAVANQFIPSTTFGFPGAAAANKPWALPPDREYAAKMPFYRDFAQDVVEMSAQLHSLIDEAQRVAEQPQQTQPVFDPNQHTSAAQPSTNAPKEFDFGGGIL